MKLKHSAPRSYISNSLQTEIDAVPESLFSRPEKSDAQAHYCRFVGEKIPPEKGRTRDRKRREARAQISASSREIPPGTRCCSE